MTHINSLAAPANYNSQLEVPILSGQRVNLLNPDPSTIKIVDIIAGLSNCCRFVGQLAHFYSVAQHSVVVSRIVHPRLALCGLLHDATEAYVHELGPAVKSLVGSLYRPIEDQLQEVIFCAYGLPLSAEDKARLKWADRQANIAEIRPFGIAASESLTGGLDHLLDEPIIPLDPRPGGIASPHDSMSSTDMPCNDKIAGLTGSAAASRADMAIKEFKLGLLSDLKRPLSLMDRLQGQYELAVYVVGYVSMDVVVLSAPAVLLEPDARTTTWYAAFELLGNTDLARLVLVEHAVGVDGIAGERLVGPVTVEIGQRDGAADVRVPAIARKVA